MLTDQQADAAGGFAPIPTAPAAAGDFHAAIVPVTALDHERLHFYKSAADPPEQVHQGQPSNE